MDGARARRPEPQPDPRGAGRDAEALSPLDVGTSEGFERSVRGPVVGLAEGALVSSPAGEVAGPTSGVTSPAGGRSTGLFAGSASAATDSYSQIGELIEAIEERVLAEVERRGGRYAGMF